MQLTAAQEKILAELRRLGLPREDIFAVMLMLSREEKAAAFLEAVKDLPSADADEVRRLCGEIAFGTPEEGEGEKNSKNS